MKHRKALSFGAIPKFAKQCQGTTVQAERRREQTKETQKRRKNGKRVATAIKTRRVQHKVYGVRGLEGTMRIGELTEYRVSLFKHCNELHKSKATFAPIAILSPEMVELFPPEERKQLAKEEQSSFCVLLL